MAHNINARDVMADNGNPRREFYSFGWHYVISLLREVIKCGFVGHLGRYSNLSN